jgi:hypothetical protein
MEECNLYRIPEPLWSHPTSRSEDDEDTFLEAKLYRRDADSSLASRVEVNDELSYRFTHP